MVKNEKIEQVNTTVAGLGFEDVQIRGISNNFFIAYFDVVNGLKDTDVEFLKINFKNITQARWEELIPCRKVWVKYRGLTIAAWIEENLKFLTADCGNIVKFFDTVDKENFYQEPILLLESRVMEIIDAKISVLIN